MRTIILVILVVGALSHSQAVVNCGACSASIKGTECVNFTGAGISNREISNHGLGCNNIASAYPAIYNFDCNTSCHKGCQVTVQMGQSTSTTCMDYLHARIYTAQLDGWYSIASGDLTRSMKYDWCQCGHSSDNPTESE